MFGFTKSLCLGYRMSPMKGGLVSWLDKSRRVYRQKHRVMTDKKRRAANRRTTTSRVMKGGS